MLKNSIKIEKIIGKCVQSQKKNIWNKIEKLDTNYTRTGQDN